MEDAMGQGHGMDAHAAAAATQAAVSAHTAAACTRSSQVTGISLLACLLASLRAWA